jgi:hypothetical protein
MTSPPRRERPADAGVEAVASLLRGMIEAARQDGYDCGYEDGLSVAAGRTPQKLAQQSDVGSAAQRVA